MLKIHRTGIEDFITKTQNTLIVCLTNLQTLIIMIIGKPQYIQLHQISLILLH
nr:MAG TPA: hypothetical protein [Bacteriophage sp.]